MTTKTMTKINRATSKAFNLVNAKNMKDRMEDTTGRGYDIFMGDDKKYWIVPVKFTSTLLNSGYELAV